MKEKPVICGIAAVGPNNVIGFDGQMPWYSKQDFYHFRKTTTPFPCIFGKNTYENMSLKPLPNRLNIVCSAQFKNEYKDDVFYADSLESAINQCSDFEKLFICGGSALYKYALDHDLIKVMYLTIIQNKILAEQVVKNPGAYTYFPKDISWFKKYWNMQKITYPELPKENLGIKASFYVFSR